jgi:hypothetical protein
MRTLDQQPHQPHQRRDARELVRFLGLLTVILGSVGIAMLPFTHPYSAVLFGFLGFFLGSIMAKP